DRALRPDPVAQHQKLQKIPRPNAGVVACEQTLEETRTAEPPDGDVVRLLPILCSAPLRRKAQLDPPRSPAEMDQRPQTSESATPVELGKSEGDAMDRFAVPSQ